jgi:integrase-like protein
LIALCGLLDPACERVRVKRYGLRTEDAYLQWFRRYILVQSKRHAERMYVRKVGAFLSHLVTVGKVSASTRNQVRCSLTVDVSGLPWL